MKKNIFYCLLVILVFVACNDTWDEYYKGTVKSSEESLDITIDEFFNENQQYSEFYAELKACGLDSVFAKDQQLTVWVPDNDAMHAAEMEPNDTLRMEYHINHLPFLKSDLKSGLRIATLNGIYLQISKNGEDMYVNNAKIGNSYRLKNGVIHTIDKLMQSKINMFDYIQQLPEEYSIFRDSVMKLNEMLFDKANSTPIGVDMTGNTVYDSVFYVYNPLFEKAQFNSEFKQFTLFLPSNEVVKNCFDKLITQYASMGKTVTGADSATAMTWIREAAFYDGEVKDFTPEDLYSSFKQDWRTSIQKVDESNPVELSNGLLYYTTDMKIPTNYILTRIKSLVHYYQYLTTEEQAQYYSFMNATGVEIWTDDGSKTPYPNILPNYWVLTVTGDATSTDPFYAEFPPLERYTDEAGNYKARIMQVPCGEYDLYMGFHSTGHPYVNVYFDGDTDGTTASSDDKMQLIGANLPITLPTPWNYDRNTETTAELYGDKVKKWDGLGGPIGTVTVKGEGMSSFRIRVEFNKPESVGGAKRLRMYHWALKPSANNY